MPIQRHRNTGGARDAGPYTYVHIGTTEVQYSDDNRVSEGQERNTDTQGIVQTGAERVYEQEFLDKGILRQYSRIRRKTNPRVHTEPRKDGNGRTRLLKFLAPF
jgi:hypothetical protein